MWDRMIEYFSTLEHRPFERMAFLVGGLLFFGSSKVQSRCSR